MWLNSGRFPRERSLLSTSNLNFLCFEALTNIRYFSDCLILGKFLFSGFQDVLIEELFYVIILL